MKKLIRLFFYWIFKEELEKLKKAKKEVEMLSTHLKETYAFMDVSVDVHEYDHQYSPSWAVISIQGGRYDYLKFMNLGSADALEISSFLRRFEKARGIKVDAAPQLSQMIKMESNRY